MIVSLKPSNGLNTVAFKIWNVCAGDDTFVGIHFFQQPYLGILLTGSVELGVLEYKLTAPCTEASPDSTVTEKQFRIRKREEILQDLDDCREMYGPWVRRVFFADGDALIVPTELLLELLDYVHKNFPGVERITSYGTAHDVLRKSEEELKLMEREEAARRRRAEIAAELCELAKQVREPLASQVRRLADRMNSWDV